MKHVLNIKRNPLIRKHGGTGQHLPLDVYDSNKQVFTGWLEDTFSDIEEDLKFLEELRNKTKTN